MAAITTMLIKAYEAPIKQDGGLYCTVTQCCYVRTGLHWEGVEPDLAELCCPTKAKCSNYVFCQN